MGSQRDSRRAGAATATGSAGAVLFFAAGVGPASADSRATAGNASECKLGSLICGILGGGGTGTPTAPPSSGGGHSSMPKPAPKPTVRPKPGAEPTPARPHHSG